MASNAPPTFSPPKSDNGRGSQYPSGLRRGARAISRRRNRAVEKHYWLSRESEEIDMARCATSPEARLVHQELATRYGAKAKSAETDALAASGITTVQADHYLVNGYRYTAAGDAIAEARRGVA